MKKNIKVIVRDAMNVSDRGCPSEGWPPEDLGRFEYWLESLMETIPGQYRNETKIVFTGGKDEDDQEPVRLVVSYSRTETDEEEQRREAWERFHKVGEDPLRNQTAHLLIAREIKQCNAEQKRILLDLLKKECGE